MPGVALAPFVPSPQPMIDTMLTVAGTTPSDLVYDLGSGTGDIVITAAGSFGAQATGIEIDEDLVALSAARLVEHSVVPRARILRGDFLEVDLAPATVVTLYQLPAVNDLLRPLLQAQLRPGARVVSLDFPVPGWEPRRVVTSRLPDGSKHAVFLYLIGLKQEVTMAPQRAYALEQFRLELDGLSAGMLETTGGGGVSADVVNEKIGPDLIVHKHLAGVKYEDITVTCGPQMWKALYAWLADTLDRKLTRTSGAIVGGDHYSELERMNFYNALVSAITFPGLDAGSKDPGFLTVKISPEYTRWVAGQKTAFAIDPGTKGGGQKWLSANFALHIDGLDCTRVQAIDPLTVRLVIEEDPVGEVRDYQKQPARLDVPNLAVTMADIDADTFRAWLDDFVIKGNNAPSAEKHGTLEYRSPAQEVYFTLTFQNLGIVKLTRLPLEADKVRRVRAEMYCEQIGLQPGTVAMPGPVQGAEAGPETAPTPIAYPSFTVHADGVAPTRSLTPLGAADASKLRVAGLRFRR
jgi:SAM-dependent methyltransferase